MNLSTYHGETPLILKGPDIEDARPGDPDTVTYEVLTSSDYLNDLGLLGFYKGQQVPEPGFHAITLQSIRILRESDHLRLLSLTCTGILSDLSIDPAANSSRTFDPTPGTETYTFVGLPLVRATFQPTLTHTYFTTSEPDTTLIGQIIPVDNPPSCPGSRITYRIVIADSENPGQYKSYGEYPAVLNIQHYVDQWVLDNRVPETIYQLAGTGLWKVTDTIVRSTLIRRDAGALGATIP